MRQLSYIALFCYDFEDPKFKQKLYQPITNIACYFFQTQASFHFSVIVKMAQSGILYVEIHSSSSKKRIAAKVTPQQQYQVVISTLKIFLEKFFCHLFSGICKTNISSLIIRIAGSDYLFLKIFPAMMISLGAYSLLIFLTFQKFLGFMYC